MELVVIALFGTALLMAAELREFVLRRRFIFVSAEPVSAPSASARAPGTTLWAAEEENFYDAAA